MAPSIEHIKEAILRIRKERKDIGILKLLDALRNDPFGFQLSEKRLRKILAEEKVLVDYKTCREITTESFSIDETLKIKYVDSKKGRGIFASKDIPADMNLFEESPVVFFPGWDIIRMMESNGLQLCWTCAKPLKDGQFLVRKCSKCETTFCSRECHRNGKASFI